MPRVKLINSVLIKSVVAKPDKVKINTTPVQKD